MPAKKIVVLVHGWSVKHTNTYGRLADRLKSESQKPGAVPLDVRQIWLSKYVSFKDEVRVEDLSYAFQAALERELKGDLTTRGFACITHSTGGPVVRDWWQRLYIDKKNSCPMSHLIMLAPANFGSALAQLGKSRLSRIKSWFQGVEPGQGVLDWLEMGSPESWDLNLEWLKRKSHPGSTGKPVFPFVLTGQSIDRSLFDQVNSYTGEIGSDGVVRVAAANINADYLRLVQNPKTHELEIDETNSKQHKASCFRLIEGKAHSKPKMGILNSIKDDKKDHASVDAILNCLKVSSFAEYKSLGKQFDKDNEVVIRDEYREKTKIANIPRTFIHDRRSMLIVRLRDDTGHPISDFDFLLTGVGGNPNRLPEGFFIDRQKNSRDGSTLTYFLNHTALTGEPAAPGIPQEDMDAKPSQGVGALGLKIVPRPDDGFVHYRVAELVSKAENIDRILKKDQTTMIDIVLNRIVHRGVFELINSKDEKTKGSGFKNQKEGTVIAKK